MIKFKYYKTNSKFQSDVQNHNIDTDDIVFVEDYGMLSTHQLYWGFIDKLTGTVPLSDDWAILKGGINQGPVVIHRWLSSNGAEDSFAYIHFPYLYSGDDLTLATKDDLPEPDWNENSSYSKNYIKNKPTIPAAQIQSDWTLTNTSAKDYIKNKPSLHTVATSGSYSDLTDKPTLFSGNYNDLSNKPSIPDALIQSDWNQTNTSAKDYIKNKPSLFSGSYNDLSNKPTIPSLTGYATESWVNTKFDDAFGINADGVSTLAAVLSDSNYATGILTQIANKVDKETGKGLSSNDYTTTEKNKLAGIATGATAVTESTVSGWGFTKNTGTLTSETDPVFTASAAYGITSTDINNWNAKQNALTFNTTPSSSNKVATMSDITKSNVGLSNVTDNAQVKGLASGTTEDHVIVFGTDGYTIKDSGKTIGASVPSNAVFTDTTYNFIGIDFYSTDSTNATSIATDCNAIVNNGHFYYTSNGPSTSLGATTNDGALYTQAYSTSWVTQIAQDYRNGRLFVRGKNNGTWTDWKKVALSTATTVAVTANAANVTCPVTLLDGEECTVIYTNATSTEYNVTVSTSYSTPDGQQLDLACPAGGYCEVNYLKIGNTIYARGV